MKNDDDQPSPFQRFEDLAKRVFRKAKEDVEKVEEAATDLVKPAEEPEAD